jgi:hypothetical protein
MEQIPIMFVMRGTQRTYGSEFVGKIWRVLSLEKNTMDNFNPYYIPKNRRELIAYLVKKWPNGNWQKKSRACLMAVYRKTRDKEN